jgi:hypothetical protein
VLQAVACFCFVSSAESRSGMGGVKPKMGSISGKNLAYLQEIYIQKGGLDLVCIIAKTSTICNLRSIV